MYALRAESDTDKICYVIFFECQNIRNAFARNIFGKYRCGRLAYQTSRSMLFDVNKNSVANAAGKFERIAARARNARKAEVRIFDGAVATRVFVMIVQAIVI